MAKNYEITQIKATMYREKNRSHVYYGVNF